MENRARKRGKMTTSVLKRAVELNEKIEKIRREKGELEEIRGKCWGNASEVLSRCFCIEVIEGNGKKMGCYISATATKAALDNDIKRISGKLEELEKEFEELN